VNWFQRHPNWTWILAWLVIFGGGILGAGILGAGSWLGLMLVVGGVGGGITILRRRRKH